MKCGRTGPYPEQFRRQADHAHQVVRQCKDQHHALDLRQPPHMELLQAPVTTLRIDAFVRRRSTHAHTSCAVSVQRSHLRVSPVACYTVSDRRGSNSSMRLLGQAGSFSNVSFNQA